jgi:AcrR family transcriptional regulator
MVMYDRAMSHPSGHRPELPLSPRIERRQLRTRDALLAAGARQFCRKGIEAVSVEDLLADADVSRATFYAMFNNKYNVLDYILNPLFDEFLRAVSGLVGIPPGAALEALLRLYPTLWRQNREGLQLLGGPSAQIQARFAQRYRALHDAQLALLQRVEQAGLLRNGSAHFSFNLLNQVSIPLLRVYEDQPAGHVLFEDAMRRLLLKDS